MQSYFQLTALKYEGLIILSFKQLLCKHFLPVYINVIELVLSGFGIQLAISTICPLQVDA
jgi:hypothetical protein